MKYVAAYLLLSLANPHPTKSDVKNLLWTVGIEPDEERLNRFFEEIEGQDIDEVDFACCYKTKAVVDGKGEEEAFAI